MKMRRSFEIAAIAGTILLLFPTGSATVADTTATFAREGGSQAGTARHMGSSISSATRTACTALVRAGSWHAS
jgi:hypothetical protein